MKLYIEGHILHLAISIEVFNFVMEEVRARHMSARFIATDQTDSSLYWIEAQAIIDHPEYLLGEEVN